VVDVPREQRIDFNEYLFKVTPDQYSGEYQNHLLEQYKLYVQMADKISERRQSANTFFLTVNTTLIAFLGVIAKLGVGGALPYSPLPWVLVVSAAGVVLCYSWYRLVRSYKGLNRGKFEVVQALESKLPSSPYDVEWIRLGEGKNPKRYLPFTHVETKIPWVFVGLYIAFAVWNTVQSVLLGVASAA
jgi:hypothetical protein